MITKSQKLSEFFNIGRDRGWDIEKQCWTVHQLINPEGKIFTLGEILDGIPLDLRLEKSGNRYGYPPLREAIQKSQHYRVPRENVLVTSGTQHANFLSLATLLESGDEAVIEAPSWEQPKVVCEALGASAKILHRRPELGWKFDLGELESLMSPKVKVIYVCHPSNPTGATLTEAELRDICEIASKFGTYVISDEIYRGLEWEGGISPSIVNIYERGVTTSSLSKTLGMSGLRIGWLATQDRDFLERCMDLKYYVSLHQQSRLDEVVAMAALQPDKYWNLVGRTMAAAKVNYDITSALDAKQRHFQMGSAQGRLSFVSELRPRHSVMGLVRANCLRSPTKHTSCREAATELRNMCGSDLVPALPLKVCAQDSSRSVRSWPLPAPGR